MLFGILCYLKWNFRFWSYYVDSKLSTTSSPKYENLPDKSPFFKFSYKFWHNYTAFVVEKKMSVISESSFSKLGLNFFRSSSKGNMRFSFSHILLFELSIEFRSSRTEVFCKKVFLETSQNS